MNALPKLQQDFKDCMLGNSKDMHGQVVSTTRADAEERVWIYVDGYRLRLLEVLQDNYTGLHTLVGDEQFDELARAYIDAHPSTNPSVRWFGRHLPEFLRVTAPYSTHPYLAEMAAFEWAQGLVFDATDAPVLEMQALASLVPETWANLRFTLHPSLQRLALGWNVPQAWVAMDEGNPPPELQAHEFPAPWLLWRMELTTRWRSLSLDEAWALDAVRAGKDFSALCEGLCQWHAPEAVAMQAVSYLKLWLTDGLVSELHTD